jgi:hypothetical protein
LCRDKRGTERIDIGNVGARRTRAHGNADGHDAKILHRPGATALCNRGIEPGPRIHYEIRSLPGGDSRVDLSRSREFKDDAMARVALNAAAASTSGP